MQASQYVHRVKFALEHAKAEYTVCDVNLLDKPEWYTKKINPAGRVRYSLVLVRIHHRASTNSSAP